MLDDEYIMPATQFTLLYGCDKQQMDPAEPDRFDSHAIDSLGNEQWENLDGGNR